MDISVDILIRRKKAKLTQQELANRSGVSRQTISDIERSVRLPKESTKRKIYEGLADWNQ